MLSANYHVVTADETSLTDETLLEINTHETIAYGYNTLRVPTNLNPIVYQLKGGLTNFDTIFNNKPRKL